MDYLQGNLGEWFFLILFSVLFMAIAGIVLPKRLTEHRFGKTLVVSLGLLLGLGLFSARKIFHFNFESFGFLGLGIVIFLLGIVTFGLARIGMRKDLAISFSYCMMFLTFRMVSPSLYDAIAESLPILNLLFVLTFLYFGGNLLFKIFGSIKKHGYLEQAEKNVSLLDNESEFDREFKDEKKEERDVKKRIIRFTRSEISSVEKIEKLIEELILTIRNHPHLNQSDVQEILHLLERIGKKKHDFMKSMAYLKEYINKNQSQDKQRIEELRQRLNSTKNGIIKKEIEQELLLEKKKMDIYAFILNEEKRIVDFLNFFSKNLLHVSQYLRIQNNQGALNLLALFKNKMGTMREHIEKLLRYEKYLKTLIKKEEKILKSSKK